MKMDNSFLYRGQMQLMLLVAPIETVLASLEAIEWYQYSDYNTFERVTIIPNTDLYHIMDIEYKTHGIENTEINIIWEPSIAPGHTVIRTSLTDGRYTLSHRLAKNGIDCYRFNINNDILPAYFFHRISPNKATERVVQYINEGDMEEFYQEGELLPFENSGYYRRRRKKDRINPDIIVEYMSALGWDILDDNFWRSNKEAYKDTRIFKGNE
jgi:hypothetical protein